MEPGRFARTAPALTVLAVLAAQGLLAGRQAIPQESQGTAAGRDEPRFRSGIALVNVTATVTDDRGHFVAGLRQEDFRVYEDGLAQTITQFSNERVPVSLGIALDTSGSMAGEKLEAARTALDRFLFNLLGPEDEIFLYRFSDQPELVQGWTSDRRELSRALGFVRAFGGTAMLDTLAETVPLAETGRHPKKAVIIISDGNDTVSRTHLAEVKQLIRRTEVLVYAVGIDGAEPPVIRRSPPPRGPVRIPIPLPPRPGPRSPWPVPREITPGLDPQATFGRPRFADGVNVAALRDITDDSGGRTETIRTSRDMDPATAGIADELTKQYYLAYPSTEKSDGLWHTIRVEVRNRSLQVRARRGYVASSPAASQARP